MSMMWIVPAGMLGEAENIYASNKPVAVNNSDGSVTLYLYSPANGIAAYKIDKYEGVEGVESAKFSVNVSGNVAKASVAADFRVYNAAGMLVKKAANVNSVNLNGLACGIYLLSASAEGKTVVSKVTIL